VQARSFGSAGAATRAAFPEDRALRPAELEAFLARKR
jgi:hypothetical protein